jgi:hypothetical protein
VSRFALAAIALLLLLSAAARADIYRWEDESGTAHFTDDISNIPAAHRGKARMVIREAPPEATSPSTPERGLSQPSIPAVPATPREDEAEAMARERESLASQIEQLKAKIAAKENLVKFVDDRQNLALNPLRNRVIDPGDLELYRKYQAELPEDRERLQDLQSRLRNFR